MNFDYIFIYAYVIISQLNRQSCSKSNLITTRSVIDKYLGLYDFVFDNIVIFEFLWYFIGSFVLLFCYCIPDDIKLQLIVEKGTIPTS